MGSEEGGIIQRLTAAAKKLGRPEGECPCCKAESGFKRHDERRRQVLVPEGSFVLTCWIILVRWKCSSCGTTFTHYPEFLVPCKRYVLCMVLKLSERYVAQPETSYREVVAPGGMPCGYAERPDGSIDERQLSHTTLWHWLTWLGGLTALSDQATDLLRQKDPGFELHRTVTPIAAAKHRSSERRNLLEQGASLLRTAAEFTRHFSRRIFPTLCNSARARPG